MFLFLNSSQNSALNEFFKRLFIAKNCPVSLRIEKRAIMLLLIILKYIRKHYRFIL